MRAELLPAVPPGRTPCRGGRYIDETCWVSVCCPRHMNCLGARKQIVWLRRRTTQSSATAGGAAKAPHEYSSVPREECSNAPEPLDVKSQSDGGAKDKDTRKVLYSIPPGWAALFDYRYPARI
jgi:hypothetical protein